MLDNQIQGGAIMKKVFVSYHYTAMDGSNHGFGNYIGEFEAGVYEDNLGKFILDLEETIARQLEEKTKVPCGIKIMYFR